MDIDRQAEKWAASVSCQRDICSEVAKHKILQAANQEATKTTDSELEKWQAHKNRSRVYLCTTGFEGLFTSPSSAEDCVVECTRKTSALLCYSPSLKFECKG